MRNWYCVYTKRGQEDSVSFKLSELPNLEVLNPKIQRRKYVRHRSRFVNEELFPSYIFSRLDLEQYGHLVQYTRGVRRFVGDRSGRPYEVDLSIINFLKARLHNGIVLIEQDLLRPGDQVRIHDGPFTGLTGEILLGMKPNERVMVLLTSLERQLKVEFPSCCLSRL